MLSAKPWRTEAVFFFIAAQALSLCLGTTAIAVMHKAGVSGFKDPDGFGAILIGTLCFQGVTWPLMAVFFHQQDIHWRDGLGLHKKQLMIAPLLAVGALVFVIPSAWALQSASLWLMEKFHWKPHTEAAVSLFTNATSRPEQIYLGIFAIVLAPVAEEFIFRGVLYTFIKQKGFPKTAWLGVNLLFALIHGDAGIFVPLFVLAIALTWLYEITDSLLAPICAHGLFNAANLVLLNYFPQ